MKDLKYIGLWLLSVMPILFWSSCDDSDDYSAFIQIKTGYLKNITYDSAECGGEVVSGRAKERGVCWSTSPMPTVADAGTQDGDGSGVFKSILTGLSEGTTYYVRAWGKNSRGEVVYGEQKQCVTMAHGRPVVNISGIKHIKEASATVVSQMLVDGGIEVNDYGIIYDEAPDLSLDKGVVKKLTVSKNPVGTMLAELTDNKVYYVVAFATYKAGTVYSDPVSFKTVKYSDPHSSLETDNVTGDSFEAKVQVKSGTPLPVLEFGIVYSLTSGPTVAHDVAKRMGEGDGEATAEIAGLESDTRYYVRPYAKNKNGVFYGEEVEVLTLSNKALVSTVATTRITAHRAFIGGEILSLGLKGAPVKEAGICWGIKTNPTLDNNYVKASATEVGEFDAVQLFCLHPSTKYYARAYVTNDYGTNYGEEVSFTTREPVANYFKASIAGSDFNSFYMDDETPGNYSADQAEAYAALATALKATSNSRILTKLQYYITPDVQGTPRYLCAYVGYTSTSNYVATWKTKMDMDDEYVYTCSHFEVDIEVNKNSTSITNKAKEKNVWDVFLRSLNYISDYSFVLDWDNETTTPAPNETIWMIPVDSPEKYKRMSINKYSSDKKYEDWW